MDSADIRTYTPRPSYLAIEKPMSFAPLELCDPLLKALDELEYRTPTDIQSRAIPEILAGKDLIAAAQTGTGKTASFVLPILEQLQPPPKRQSQALPGIDSGSDARAGAASWRAG